jgi:hypothetical protein
MNSERREMIEVGRFISRERMLGHDGFTLAFFQVCWDVIKADIMGVFHDFHARSKFEKKP